MFIWMIVGSAISYQKNKRVILLRIIAWKSKYSKLIENFNFTISAAATQAQSSNKKNKNKNKGGAGAEESKIAQPQKTEPAQSQKSKKNKKSKKEKQEASEAIEEDKTQGETGHADVRISSFYLHILNYDVLTLILG